MNRAGWEPIWNSQHIPPRYQTTAAPDNSVVDWSETLSPGARVFDLGCGVGRHVMYLGGRGFRIAGSDVSPTGLKRTSAACAENGYRFVGCVCEMSRLPWRSGTFDAALSTATIHHALRANIQRSIDEVWRLLRPGGAFLVDFPCMDSVYDQMKSKAALGQIKEVEPNTFVDDRSDSDDSDGMLPHHWCDEADVRDLLRGFTVQQLWTWSRGAGLGGKWIASAQKPI